MKQKLPGEIQQWGVSSFVEHLASYYLAAPRALASRGKQSICQEGKATEGSKQVFGKQDFYLLLYPFVITETDTDFS